MIDYVLQVTFILALLVMVICFLYRDVRDDLRECGDEQERYRGRIR